MPNDAASGARDVRRMAPRVAFSGIAAALLLSACTAPLDGLNGEPPVASYPPPAVQQAPAAPPAITRRSVRRTHRPGYDAVGLASWYGRPYHGRRTASGEIFNMNDTTAAHPTLPFGTRVQVTNLANGRSVVVRINDRGPFVRRRIIDVSRHAAQLLGFIRQGTVRVGIHVIGPGPG